MWEAWLTTQSSNLLTLFHIIAGMYSNSPCARRWLCVCVCDWVGTGPKNSAAAHITNKINRNTEVPQSCCQRVKYDSRPGSWISVVDCEAGSITWTADIGWSTSCTTGRAANIARNVQPLTWLNLVSGTWLPSHEPPSLTLHTAGLSDIITTTDTCTRLTLPRRIALRLHVRACISTTHTHTHTHTHTAGVSRQPK